MESVSVAGRRTDETGWRAALALIGVVTLLRIAYQAWLSPWQLVGDEAYYWVQGQHLDWCYNEKGALFPWLIRLSCTVFGNTQFAVRLPVLLGSTLGALLLCDLAWRIAPPATRAATGLIAVGLFFLTPGLQANAQISTQDGLLIPWTLGMTTIGLLLVRRWSEGRGTWGLWMAWWALLGVGMHLRFSAPLLLTAPACFAWFQRRQLKFGKTFILQQIVGGVAFAVFLLPIILWNSRNGWPTFEHTAGHLGLGGDQAGHTARGNPLIWVSSVIGGVIGAYGPVFVLVVWATWRSLRHRQSETPASWTDQLWLLCSVWPSVAFFVLLSFTKPVLASWPLPSLVPALALAALHIERESLFTWLPRPWFRPLWTATLIYGLAGALLLMFPTCLRYLPGVGKRLDEKVISRLGGHAEQAAAVQRAIVQSGLQHPEIVASYYDTASLLWFYLPDHPVVHVASHRPSTYDNWPDTRLDAGGLRGKSMLLVGTPRTGWPSLLQFAQIQSTANPAIQIGQDFGGELIGRTALAHAGLKGEE